MQMLLTGNRPLSAPEQSAKVAARRSDESGGGFAAELDQKLGSALQAGGSTSELQGLTGGDESGGGFARGESGSVAAADGEENVADSAGIDEPGQSGSEAEKDVGAKSGDGQAESEKSSSGEGGQEEHGDADQAEDVTGVAVAAETSSLFEAAGDGELEGEGPRVSLMAAAGDEPQTAVAADLVDDEISLELPPEFDFFDLPVSVVEPAGGQGEGVQIASGLAAIDGEVAVDQVTVILDRIVATGSGNADKLAAELTSRLDGRGAPVEVALQSTDRATSRTTTTGQPAGQSFSAEGSSGALSPSAVTAAAAGQSASGRGDGAASGQLPGSLATASNYRTSVDQPVRSAAWGSSLGSRVAWMAGAGIEQAEIRLNPRHLGPLEVRVTMNGDQANVTFVSHSPQVREALEAATPRLREMLAENGLGLARMDVSDQSQRQQQSRGDGEGEDGRRGESGSGERSAVGESEAVVEEIGEGMLNLFA